MLARTRLMSLMVCAALVGVVGCDGDDNGTDAGPMTDAPMTMEDGGPGEDGGETGTTIVDLAVADGRFGTLLAAAERAGIAALLTTEGPFTVFAPTDDAFEAFFDAHPTFNEVDDVPPAALAGILTYHAISGQRVLSSALPARAGSAADGLTLFFSTEGGAMVNDANITEVDLEADNGVIHVIDRVLLPPNIPQAAGFAGLDSLVAAVVEADLAETLSGEGPFTVFAPTNDAFAALLTALGVEGVDDIDDDLLTSVLLYHVVGAAVPSSAVPDSASSSSTMTFGEGGDAVTYPLTLFFDTSDGVVINGGIEGDGDVSATVQVADVLTTNGIVHVIDRVLMPLSIAQVAQIAPGFGTLVEAVLASDPITVEGTDVAVIEALSGDLLAPFTVFAPTDAAFTAAFPGGLPADGGAILGVLGLHVLTGETPVLAAGLPADPTTEVSPLAGSPLTFDASADPPTVTVTGGGTTADIIATDIGATNGVVHAIDGVLLEAD